MSSTIITVVMLNRFASILNHHEALFDSIAGQKFLLSLPCDFLSNGFLSGFRDDCCLATISSTENLLIIRWKPAADITELFWILCSQNNRIPRIRSVHVLLGSARVRVEMKPCLLHLNLFPEELPTLGRKCCGSAFRLVRNSVGKILFGLS